MFSSGQPIHLMRFGQMYANNLDDSVFSYELFFIDAFYLSIPATALNYCRNAEHWRKIIIHTRTATSQYLDV